MGHAVSFATTLQHLSELRGFKSPPLTSPDYELTTTKRRPTSRRFFSLSGAISRSMAIASVSRRATSTSWTADAPRSSTSTPCPGSFTPTIELDYATLGDHQLKAVRCINPTKRTHVSREMAVCKRCLLALGDMRSMLARYDKTGSIRGTTAFDKFLRWDGEGAGDAEGDLTVAADEGAEFGARQAIVMGMPKSAPSKERLKRLGMMRNGEEKRCHDMRMKRGGSLGDKYEATG